MEVALLVFSVIGFVIGCIAIMATYHARYDNKKSLQVALEALEATKKQYNEESASLSKSSEALSKLHNESVRKLEALEETVETLKLRFHGVNPQPMRRP